VKTVENEFISVATECPSIWSPFFRECIYKF